MSVPGVASKAAEQIQEDVVTDAQAERNADEEAHRLEEIGEESDENLEAARDVKGQAEDTNDENAGNGDNDEAGKLESGAFQPHAYPHINWPDSTDSPSPRKESATNGSDSLPNGKPNGKPAPKQEFRTYGRGGAGRKAPNKGPQITSEAAELARAEAASWAQMSPLMAATLGPLSVLLGIPTLTQRWHGLVLDPPLLPNGISNFQELPDPPLNLALAGASLLCEVLGNALLVLRFSNFHTKITTWVSYGFWIAKIILGVANYIQFGITHPETDDIIYLAGFWVISRRKQLISRSGYVVWV
jgi:hypothetical protein